MLGGREEDGKLLKRAIMCVVCIFVICVLLPGCYGRDIRNYIPGMWNPYRNERPTAFVPSKWVSDEPYIWFNVLADDDVEGQATVDGKVINIVVHFDGGRGILVFDSDKGGIILRGFCEFSSEGLVVEVDEESDLLYNFKYPKITFYKCAIDDETSA